MSEQASSPPASISMAWTSTLPRSWDGSRSPVIRIRRESESPTPKRSAKQPRGAAQGGPPLGPAPFRLHANCAVCVHLAGALLARVSDASRTSEGLRGDVPREGIEDVGAALRPPAATDDHAREGSPSGIGSGDPPLNALSVAQRSPPCPSVPSDTRRRSRDLQRRRLPAGSAAVGGGTTGTPIGCAGGNCTSTWLR